MSRLFVRWLNDLGACLNHLVSGRHPVRSMCLMLVALAVTWFAYVPVHELLHAAGCAMAGGAISRLEISPRYGGTLLARWFSFVVPGGDYAGRLSGFDTKGSDLIYLATDIAPYVLTILSGVPLLRACVTRRRPIVFAIGVVVGLAPFYNLPGDYYEMGSIITTRAVTALQGRAEPVALAGIRSDDVFKLIGDLVTHPAELGLVGIASIMAASLLIVVSFVVGIVLAIMTYAAGDCVARLISRASHQPAASSG